MGAEAVLALMETPLSTASCVIAIDGNQIVRVPLKEAVQKVYKPTCSLLVVLHFASHFSLTQQ